MSSTNIAKEMVDEVTKDQVVLSTEGDQQDVPMLHSSDNEESEQDHMVDEALQVKPGEGTESTKVVEDMDVNNITPKVGADYVKPIEQIEETGNLNQEVGIGDYNDDKDMTLDSLFEENEGKIDDERGEDLDQYLEVLMLDSTMTVVKAMKGGDVVLIVPCPHMDHKVNLNKGQGFFMLDLAEKARITKEKQLELADYCNEMTGCVGYDDCTYSLADAIESTECPEEVFCF